MSFTTLDQASKDEALINRTLACCAEQAFTDPTIKETNFAALVRQDTRLATPMVWPVAINGEAAYESAIVAGNPNPGGDPAVITDGDILAAVQVHWPPDPVTS